MLIVVRNTILRRLRTLPPAPSAASHEIPPDAIDFEEDEDEEGTLKPNRERPLGCCNTFSDPDAFSVREENARIQQDNELYDSDDEFNEKNIEVDDHMDVDGAKGK